MPSVKYLKIPAIPNFANLIVYPAPQGVSVLANFCNYNILILGQSSIYLLSGCSAKPVISDKSVSVEFLADHVYCLALSVGTNIGSYRLFTSIPGFIKDLQYRIYLGEVCVYVCGCGSENKIRLQR